MVSNKGTGATVMVNDFTIGCDPEFATINPNGSLMVNHLDNTGEIGKDHGGHVVELRPGPTKGTYALVKKLQRLIDDQKLKAPEFERVKFRAGAFIRSNGARPYVSLGGHFHYGIKPAANRWDPNPVRVTALDRVTWLLEHLDILPTDECVERRNTGGYGAFGAIRTSGREEDHLEYRTMASWLFDPKVAFTCLTAAKLAVAAPESTVEALQNVTSFEGLKTWVRRFHARDSNAKRLTEKVLDRGLPALQVDPDVDFRGRWENLGL